MDILHGAMENIPPVILLVEDDPGVRRSLQLLLRGQGYEVKAYSEGQPLLNDPQKLNAACLIADYRLGDTNGTSVLSQLRALGWNGPAILITASPSTETKKEAEAAGFNVVLEKPLNPHTLLRLLSRLVPVT